MRNFSVTIARNKKPNAPHVKKYFSSLHVTFSINLLCATLSMQLVTRCELLKKMYLLVNFAKNDSIFKLFS